MINASYNLLLAVAKDCKDILIPILLIFLIAHMSSYFKNKAKIYKKINSLINEINAEDVKQISNGDKGDIIKFKN